MTVKNNKKSMKTKHCDECKHHEWIGMYLKCKKGHKLRFYMPKNELDQNWGHKRKCEDYEHTSNLHERIVMFENCGDWRKERPGLPCLFATRTKLPSGIYHYNFYKMVEYQDSDNYYFAWCDLDGEEIDDIHNLEADEYLILIVGSNFST